MREWSQPPTRRKLLVVLVPRRRGRRVALTSWVNGPLCGGRHRSRRRRQGRPIRPLGHQSYVEGTAPQVQGRGGGVETLHLRSDAATGRGRNTLRQNSEELEIRQDEGDRSAASVLPGGARRISRLHPDRSGSTA